MSDGKTVAMPSCIVTFVGQCGVGDLASSGRKEVVRSLAGLKESSLMVEGGRL